MEIRNAEKEDLESIIKMRNLFFKDQARKGMANYPIKLNSFLNRTSLELIKNKYVYIFTCFDDSTNEPIGYLLSRIKVMSSDYKYPLIGFLEELFIHEKFREQGAASLLIKKTLNNFDTLNLKLIEMQVLTNNVQAVAFWKKQNFVSNVLHMEKTL